MMIRKFPLLTLPLLAITLALPLQGCLSSLVVKPISEANKDTSGAFDGRWTGTIKSTPAKQQGPGNWTMTCTDRTGDKFAINVSGGEANMGLANRQNKTFVNSKGQFRFEVPTGSNVTASGTSDSSLNDGSVTLILTGSLEDMAGNFIIGIADLSNAGCTSKVIYERG